MAYHKTCESDPAVKGAADKKAKHEAMNACVSNAATADTANGKACTDFMAKMEKHHHDKPATPPAGT